jgi:dihydroxyacetone kinase-like predicted kinase
MTRLLNGEQVTHPNGAFSGGISAEGSVWQVALEPDDEEGYGYDVQFLMHGASMDIDAIRAAIDAMGWSTLVVGDESLIKVHVHVHDPGQPLSYAISQGASIDDVVVENMQEQYHAYVEGRLAREHGLDDAPLKDVAVITVASGEGLRRLFRNDLQAAHVIAGGQTMNPSTQDFLGAIDSLAADKIVLLPNNKNILLAAQQAAALARDKEVRVVASRTVPQGISALLAYINVAHLDDINEVADAMTEALGHVISAEVTTATRDVEMDNLDVQQGQYIGLLDGSLVAAGELLEDVLRQLLVKARADTHELITLYYGDNLREPQVRDIVDALQPEFPGQEFEIVRGDQPLYPFIISVE